MGLAAIAGAGGMQRGGPNVQPRGAAQAVRAYFEQSAGTAARFLARADGPRIGALAFDGWDTHANEGALDGRLAALLGALDAAIAAIETNMGDAWRETVVAIVTEFGRAVAANGSGGTDHGTAGAAFVAGGAVRGGRVIADWPGLGQASLHEGRDLKPTLDLRALFKAALAAQLGLGEAVLETEVFPDSRGVRALEGVLA